jgi:hypothetical protein
MSRGRSGLGIRGLGVGFVDVCGVGVFWELRGVGFQGGAGSGEVCSAAWVGHGASSWLASPRHPWPPAVSPVLRPPDGQRALRCKAGPALQGGRSTRTARTRGGAGRGGARSPPPAGPPPAGAKEKPAPPPPAAAKEKGAGAAGAGAGGGAPCQLQRASSATNAASWGPPTVPSRRSAICRSACAACTLRGRAAGGRAGRLGLTCAAPSHAPG